MRKCAHGRSGRMLTTTTDRTAVYFRWTSTFECSSVLEKLSLCALNVIDDCRSRVSVVHIRMPQKGTTVPTRLAFPSCLRSFIPVDHFVSAASSKTLSSTALGSCRDSLAGVSSAVVITVAVLPESTASPSSSPPLGCSEDGSRCGW